MEPENLEDCVVWRKKATSGEFCAGQTGVTHFRLPRFGVFWKQSQLKPAAERISLPSLKALLAPSPKY